MFARISNVYPVIRSLSLYLSRSLPRICLACILFDATREGRIEQRYTLAWYLSLMRLVNWLENWEKGEQGRGYRRRRVKKKGGRGEVGCSQAERERVTVSLPIVRGAAASGAQKHSLRTVTPRYRATCANHWTVPLGHPCQSRAFVRSVYFVARPNIHVPAAPRFSCASTSYFVRFLCIIFIYRRLLYVYIYIYIFYIYIYYSSVRLRLRFVRSLSRVAARLFLDPLPIDR